MSDPADPNQQDAPSLRDELEARVIGLIVGEISEADADKLEKILAVDEELSAFRDRMAKLMGEVHAARGEIVPPAPVDGMKLSEERRAAIFNSLETGKTEPKKPCKRWWHVRPVEVAAMFLIGGLITAMMFPSFEKVRSINGAVEKQASDAHFKMSMMMPEEEQLPFPVQPADAPTIVNSSMPVEPLGGMVTSGEPNAITSLDTGIEEAQFELAEADGRRRESKSAEEVDGFADVPAVDDIPVVGRLFKRDEGREADSSAGAHAADTSRLDLSDAMSDIVEQSFAVDQVEVRWLSDFDGEDTESAISKEKNSSGSVVTARTPQGDASGPKGAYVDTDHFWYDGFVESGLDTTDEALTIDDSTPSTSRFHEPSISGKPMQLQVESDDFDQVAESWKLKNGRSPALEVANRESLERRYAYSNGLKDGPAPKPSAEIEAKFLEVPSNDLEGVRFDWSLAIPDPAPEAEGLLTDGQLEVADADERRRSEADLFAPPVTRIEPEYVVGGVVVDAFALSPPPAPPRVASPGASTVSSGLMLGEAQASKKNKIVEEEAQSRPSNNEALEDLVPDERSKEARERMLTEITREWNRSKDFSTEGEEVYPSSVSSGSEKLKQIMIPEVNFSGMPLSKVVQTLNDLTVIYDKNELGVKVALDDAESDGGPVVDLQLRNLSFERILQIVASETNYNLDIREGGEVILSRERSPVEKVAIARSKKVRQAPKPEKVTVEAPVSTFSLNVSDVSFELAQAALASRRVPDATLIRTEEFVNSFDYGDPSPREDEPVALNWEIAQHPYQHNRQIVRFSLQTQAEGRSANQPLNLNLLVDNSGSMQRPDRRQILEQSLTALQSKLTDQDQLNVVLFARQPKLIANAVTVGEQQAAIEQTLNYKPEGGTNLESGLKVAYEVAQRNFNPVAGNRVILITDGAANLGDVDAANLAEKVVENRKQGIALDAYGIGWEDYNDELLEEITRNGDGRYAFLNDVETAAEDFAEKLAGTLRVSAADVKVQIIWNPERVKAYRQIGYDLHQLKKEDFRDNTVDAAEIGEAESGTALYIVQIDEDPEIAGGLGKLQVRYRVPSTGEYVERAWPLEMPHQIPDLPDAAPSMRLAAVSALFAERLAMNPYASNYSFEDLRGLMIDLEKEFPNQERVVELQHMNQSALTLYAPFE